MNYISTTGLRTQSSELIDMLLAGRSVDLMYRSKRVAKMVPDLMIKKNKVNRLSSFVKKYSGIKGLTQEVAIKNYHDHMMEKYGKNLL